jgi:hypothetical protein
VHLARGEQYEDAVASEVLPGIDLAQLVGFVDRPTTSQAIREYRDALRAADATDDDPRASRYAPAVR